MFKDKKFIIGVVTSLVITVTATIIATALMNRNENVQKLITKKKK
ncbi:MAG: hypothetical protein AAFQ94_09175 [Bacteroidota bacterium]